MNWWNLRSVGNLYVLKVSYAVLLIAPFLSKHEQLTAFLDMPTWLLATLFLGSLSLALANLVYDIWCPTIIKRFPSGNDLYFKMLEIKKLSWLLYPDDNFDASKTHCLSAYETQSKSRCVARWLCTVFFLVAGAAFLVVFSYRAIVVVESVFKAAG